MKLIRNISLLTFSLILLVGCNNPLNKEAVSEQGSEPIAMLDEEMAQIEEDIEVEEPMKIITCNMLKNKDSEDACNRMLNEVATDMLSSEIRRSFDIKRCDKLGGYRAEDCKNYIEESGIKGPASDDELNIMQEAMSMTCSEAEYNEDSEEEYIEPECSYDLAKCSTLKAPGLKEYCEKQLNERIDEEKMWQIVEEGDVVKCDTLITNNMKKLCKEELGIYPEEIMEEDISEENDNIGNAGDVE